ncbi:MAG TPA: shikimate kinase [Phycisphaerae bacterium]|nr:shikimate kinase [Phycisphaerae bacterium]
MNIVLVGMKHCGKSSIGRAMAARMNCAFHDVDPMIEAMHECEAGERLSVREMLIRHGEDHFRRIEGHVVCELYLKLDRSGSKNVVALGGRTALNETVVSLLKAIGTVVYLRVPAEVVYRRIEKAGLPAFLDKDDPFGSFVKLYREREPRYIDLADVVVDLEGGCGVEQAAARVMTLIEERSHGRQ